MQDILFVHGTGVRRAGYEQTLDELAPRLKGWQLHGCLWGDELGVPSGQAETVPLYDQSKDLDDDAAAQDPVQAWARLLQDPFIEIRLAAGLQADVPQDPFAPALAAIERLPLLRQRLLTQALSLDLGAGLPPLVIDGSSRTDLADATDELLDLPEHVDGLKGAASLAGGGDAGQDFAAELAARAIVAGWLLRTEATGAPMPAADGRDALVQWLAVELGASDAQHKSLWSSAKATISWPLRKLGSLGGALALRTVTWGSRRYRKTITDASALRVGDILLYQARGQKIRQKIAQAVRDVGRPVVLLGHSLGGIACVDLLATTQGLPVRALVTMGSQAPYLHELGALVSLEAHQPLPAWFPPWLNAYDANDVLSFKAEPRFGGARVHDVEIDSGQPFPVSHSAYWSQQSFWKAYSAFTQGLQA